MQMKLERTESCPLTIVGFCQITVCLASLPMQLLLKKEGQWVLIHQVHGESHFLNSPSNGEKGLQIWLYVSVLHIFSSVRIAVFRFFGTFQFCAIGLIRVCLFEKMFSSFISFVHKLLQKCLFIYTLFCLRTNLWKQKTKWKWGGIFVIIYENRNCFL